MSIYIFFYLLFVLKMYLNDKSELQSDLFDAAIQDFNYQTNKKSLLFQTINYKTVKLSMFVQYIYVMFFVHCMYIQNCIMKILI